ncbi:MAG: ATP-dependent DNA helicase RecG [Chloroflexota bacterium]
MPSALETLIKILKLEQDTGYRNTAVIGGLQSFASNWANEAHRQARRPEHHQLVEEMAARLRAYDALETHDARHEAIRYMVGRVMGRIPAPADLPPLPPQWAEQPAPAAPSPAPPPTTPPLKPLLSPAPGAQAPIEAYGSGEDEAEDEDQVPIPGERDAMPDTDHDATHAEADDEDDYVPSPAPRPRPATPRRTRRAPLPGDEAIAQFRRLQETPVTVLHKVGGKMAEKLERLGIHTIKDMLFNYPARYDDYTRMRTLNKLQPGEITTVIAAVQSVVKRQARGGRPYLLMTVDDDTAVMRVVFFGQMWLQRQFQPGGQVVLSGKVELFRGELMMTNPEWEMVEREHLHTGRIVPVYSLTKGLSARTMRRLVRQTLDEWAAKVPDYLPDSVMSRTELADLSWALEQVHYPETHEARDEARTRLTFDDLFIFQVAMMRQRHAWQSAPGQPIPATDDFVEPFKDSLPFDLTTAQRRALREILDDMAKDVPMNRLLQGDVGSGKTAVAAVAMGAAVHAGKQAALMAPTSILAEQHARTIAQLMRAAPRGDAIQVRLLTGNTGEAERQEILAGLAGGSVHIVIGTHALIQEGVEFNALGLAIIDEQHRFGVEQRGTLRSKGANPHLLVMTATPIPRTLALTLYADLDLSIIDEIPPGRTPVETRVIGLNERERAYGFIRSQIAQGRQAFVVYPLVEASERLEEVGAATDEYERLSREVFPKQRVGLLHGRMAPGEKDAVMSAFARGELDILVSTSVVEVGIDVPNASVILIENAERFGLAQLHQFRGRVGRGAHKSYCILVSTATTPDAQQRLRALEETNDGFQLAEIDWRLRGAGDMLGLRQSGAGEFRLAAAVNPRLVELAQREARTIYAEDPDLLAPEHQFLAWRVSALLDQRADVS